MIQTRTQTQTYPQRKYIKIKNTHQTKTYNIIEKTKNKNSSTKKQTPKETNL